MPAIGISHGSDAVGSGQFLPLRNTHNARRIEEEQQIVRWRPRDGRGEAFTRWEKSRESVVKRNGLQLVDGLPPPTMDEVIALMPRASSANRAKKLQESLDEYQRLNTKYFDLVRWSLDVYDDKRYWEEDHDMIEKYTIVTTDGRTISDGAGLVEWAREFANVDSLEEQAKIRLALAAGQLQKNATIIQFDDHMNSFWIDWNLLHETDIKNIMPFWKLLLHSIPMEPEQSLLTQVRSRLANAIADCAPVLTDYKTTRKNLTNYARTIGIKEGDEQIPTGGAVNVIDDRRFPGGDKKLPENNCNNCPLKACQAIVWPKRPDGKHDCIGRHDCKKPISSVKERMRRYSCYIMWRKKSTMLPIPIRPI